MLSLIHSEVLITFLLYYEVKFKYKQPKQQIVLLFKNRRISLDQGQL